jgi:AcrR family transcriptional regulator
MSKIEKSVRDIIIDKATDLYNQYGIEYVGVRELARELGTKGGNITYYFSTKDDIIAEITTRLTQSNSGIMSNASIESLSDFLSMHKKLYTNQYRYRGIFVSLPLLIAQNDEYVASYAAIQNNARAKMKEQFVHLKEMGYIKILQDDELTAIVETISFFNRFWISEAKTDMHGKESAEVIPYYIGRLASMLGLVATAKGKDSMTEFFVIPI